MAKKICVLAEACSTHCVCTIRTNVKRFQEQKVKVKKVKTYDCSTKIICYVPDVSCYQRDCKMCSGTENLVRNI